MMVLVTQAHSALVAGALAVIPLAEAEDSPVEEELVVVGNLER